MAPPAVQVSEDVNNTTYMSHYPVVVCMIVYFAAHQLAQSTHYIVIPGPALCAVLLHASIGNMKSDVVNLHFLRTRNVFYKYFRAYFQILMSVQQTLIRVINWPCVWTQMEVTHVHASMDTLEMGRYAMVGESVQDSHQYFYNDSGL